MHKIKSPTIERFLIVILVFTLLFVQQSSRKSLGIQLQKEKTKDSLLEIQSQKIRDLEEQNDVILSTLQLRESELEYWFHISSLYKENKIEEVKSLEVEDLYHAIEE